MLRLSTCVSLRQVATNASVFCTHETYETCVTVSMASVVHLPTLGDIVSHHFRGMLKAFLKISSRYRYLYLERTEGFACCAQLFMTCTHVYLPWTQCYHLRHTHPHRPRINAYASVSALCLANQISWLLGDEADLSPRMTHGDPSYLLLSPISPYLQRCRSIYTSAQSELQ